MRQFSVKAYHSVIKCDDGEEYAVDIGVVETKGVPFQAVWDSWIDSRIYFFMTQDELDELQIGDEIAEGDTLTEIDLKNPSTWTAEYNADEYTTEEGVY